MTRTHTLITLIALAACSPRSTPPAAPASDGRAPVETAAVADPAPADEPDAAPAPTEPPPVAAELDRQAAELAAYEKAKPVFDRHCANCHAQGGPGAKAKTLAHLDITHYPFGGHHADTVTETIRKSLGIDGSKPTMPRQKPGSVMGADLQLVKEWADAFDAAHPRAGGSEDGHGGKHHGGHGH